MLRDHCVVQKMEDPVAPPPSAHRHDGPDRGIGEHRVHIRGTGVISPREVTVPVGAVGPDPDLQVECRQHLLNDLEIRKHIRCAGGIDQPHGIAGTETRRLDDRCRSGLNQCREEA